MQNQTTSVYIPVETPDNKTWAFLLALLVHIGILGFIIYTNHVKNLDGEAMQTTLVTPDELAAMQGQIKANQAANAASQGNNGTTGTALTMSPEAAKLNAELAQKQAKWQQQQATIASQLDKQAMQEQQEFANQLKQNQIEEVKTLDKFKSAENTPDTQQHRDAAPQGKAGDPSEPNNNSSYSIRQGSPTGKDGTNKNPSSGINKQASAKYLELMKSRIYANWKAPNGSQGQSVKASFDLSRSGDISNISISGSDNEALKNSLIEAINATNPLPSPPEDNYAEFQSNKFTFNAKERN